MHKSKNKKSYQVGDLNLNLTFQNFLIPVINKLTRITKTNATLIDHILTNDFVNTNSSTGIVKSDIYLFDNKCTIFQQHPK